MPASNSLIILLLISLSSSSLASASENVVVTDTNGDPIVPGQYYYISSIIRGAGGGGVFPLQSGNSPCDISVFQSNLDVDKGIPVRFHVVGTTTNNNNIYSNSTDLEFEFLNVPAFLRCTESFKWSVAFDSSSSPFRVVMGRPQNYPNSELVTGVFRIQSTYTHGVNFQTLLFCPKISFSRPCYEIGISNYWNRRNLVVMREEESRDRVFGVTIQKVEAFEA